MYPKIFFNMNLFFNLNPLAANGMHFVHVERLLSAIRGGEANESKAARLPGVDVGLDLDFLDFAKGVEVVLELGLGQCFWETADKPSVKF